MVSGRRKGVLTRAAKEEEAEGTEVHDGFGSVGFRVILQVVVEGI